MNISALHRGDYQTPERMAAKLSWMPPMQPGARVLDVGCDHGYWCQWARDNGASAVLGVDRGRDVRGRGVVNLAVENARDIKGCEFQNWEIGKQWPDLGQFDHVFCMSVYHHIYEAAGGDHRPVWYWLRRQMRTGGTLIWEGPVDTRDPVVQRNVNAAYHENYEMFSEGWGATWDYFEIERIGPAVHAPMRVAYSMTAKPLHGGMIRGKVQDGSGGAKRAFTYADYRRCREIEHAIGMDPYPGSLNIGLEKPFDFDRGYYRVQLMDVVDRSKGFVSEWAPRWCRLYPALWDNREVYAMRFEGDNYPQNFVELIADTRLRTETRGTATLLREI